MTNEQIQALQAAAESVIRAHGDDWFGTGSQICTVHKSKINFIAAANPAVILSLLAERDTDKKRITELEGALSLASASFANERMRADALEARTLTVKLPPSIDCSNAHFAIRAGRISYRDEVIKELKSACAAAGIKLDVGEL